MSRFFNLIRGRAFGWFDCKDETKTCNKLPTRFGSRSRLSLHDLEDRVVPTNIVVSSSADSGANTLRTAIATANSLPDFDTISFDPSMFGTNQTIALSTALPAITTPMSIIGPGATLLTLTKAANAGIFNMLVISDSSAVVFIASISGIKVSGNGASAINIANETVTLSNLQITGTTFAGTGGAVSVAGGKVMVNNSTITGNSIFGTGGGIAATEGNTTIILDHVSINSNTASSGGGIGIGFPDCSLSVTASTISNNISDIAGSPTAPGGGGILFTGPVGANGFFIRNSTLSGNIANTIGGGIDFNNLGGTVNIQNTTIVNNRAFSLSNNAGTGGGGVAVDTVSVTTPVLNVESCIITGNVASNGRNDISTLLVDMTFTLNTSAIGDQGTGTDYITPVGIGNLPVAMSTVGALVLDPSLQLNNGGTTPTHTIGAGSSALNAGSNPASLTLDQNGNPRIQNNGVDIGAVERITTTPIATVGTLVTVNANTTGSINPYQFTITYTDAFAIAAPSIVSGNVTVSRNGASFIATPTLVSTNPAGQNSQSIVAIYQFTPPGGFWDAADNGNYSVILNANQVRNVDSVFVPSSTLGTITVNFATTYAVLNVNDSGAGSFRQAILDANVNANASDTIIFEATVFGNPRIITLTSGELPISDSLTINGPGRNLLTISGNNTSRIFKLDGNGVQTIAISDMTLTKGKAVGSGGAILDQDENLTLTRMVLTGNRATINGGALQLTQGQNTTVAIINSTINANAASATITSDGGGIAILSPVAGTDSYLILQGTTVSKNSAADDGGGISLESNTSLLFESSLLFGNVSGFASKSSDGGGLAFNGNVGSNGFVIRNSTISNNTSKAIAAALPSLSSGGLGMSQVSGTINILNSTIVANSSGGKSTGTGQGGGGIAVTGANSHLAIQSSIIALNTSANGRPDLASETAVDYDHSAIGSHIGFSDGTAVGNNIAFGTDLKLAILTGNGGTSRTVAIRPGSPLINTGSVGILSSIQLTPLTNDQRGSGFTRQVGSGLDIGAYEYIPGVPIAIPSAVALPNIDSNNAQTNPFLFNITFTADTPLNLTTIGNNDILVTGPNGFNTLATFVALDNGTDNTTRTATYSFVPPGGAWDSFDNGEFIFTILAGSIQTLAGDFVFSSQSSSMFCVMPLNLIVTTIADSGDGSLRDAIGSANGNAGGTVDIITFAPSFYSSPQTITLTGGEIPITDGINIQGPGANLLAVSGNNSSRIFNIDNSDLSQITATIRGMTISSGSTAGDGGAIQFQNEILNLTEVHVTASTAGGKGGGIAASSAGAILNVTRSTISNNKTGSDGGGAYMTGAILGGTANILNSTLANNTAVSFGGGFAGAFGAGVGIGLNLDQSTLTANSSGGAGGGFRLGDNTSTFATLNSTIVSGNSGGAGGVDIALANVTSTFTAIGNGTGFTAASKTNDLIYGASLKLSTLGDNGGPTPTVALGNGSAAIDTGTPSTGEVTDQRLAGFARSVSTNLDIGAYEVQPTVTGLIVNGGAAQRSRILLVEVFFNVDVTAAVYSLLGAVKLTRTAVASIPTGNIGDFLQSGETAFSTGIINVAQGTTNSLLLTFDNTTDMFFTSVPETATVENTSLSDGYWRLSIGLYSTPTGSLDLRRLYGDMTSNVGGTDDGADLAVLGNNFNSNFIALDFNNDGTLDGADLAIFGNRFTNTL